MDGELLDDTVNRCGQQLQFGPLLCLDQVFTDARSLAFGFRELCVTRSTVFFYGLGSRIDKGRDRRICFMQVRRLDLEILLLFGKELQGFKVGEFVPKSFRAWRTATRC